jgi:hypothetical protein
VGVGVTVGVLVGVLVGVRVGVGVGAGVAVGVGDGEPESVTTTKVANAGAVEGGAVKPTGAAGVSPVIGTETVPPAYVPERTGDP